MGPVRNRISFTLNHVPPLSDPSRFYATPPYRPSSSSLSMTLSMSESESYLGVLPSVPCSACNPRMISDYLHFEDCLSPYPKRLDFFPLTSPPPFSCTFWRASGRRAFSFLNPRDSSSFLRPKLFILSNSVRGSSSWRFRSQLAFASPRSCYQLHPLVLFENDFLPWVVFRPPSTRYAKAPPPPSIPHDHRPTSPFDCFDVFHSNVILVQSVPPAKALGVALPKNRGSRNPDPVLT